MENTFWWWVNKSVWGWFTLLVFHPQNGKLVTAGSNNTVQMHTFPDGDPDGILTRFTTNATHVTFNSSGSRVAAGSRYEIQEKCSDLSSQRSWFLQLKMSLGHLIRAFSMLWRTKKPDYFIGLKVIEFIGVCTVFLVNWRNCSRFKGWWNNDNKRGVNMAIIRGVRLSGNFNQSPLERIMLTSRWLRFKDKIRNVSNMSVSWGC